MTLIPSPKKVRAMYTDPKRLKATDPGTTENNPLWIFHDTFNPDKQWVEETKARYRAGEVGDVECKKTPDRNPGQHHRTDTAAPSDI